MHFLKDITIKVADQLASNVSSPSRSTSTFKIRPTPSSHDTNMANSKQLVSQKELNEIKYAFKSNSLNTFRKSKGHVAKLDDPTKPSITQSRTFKLLQETLDNGLKEKEAIFYDSITNKNQTRRCSLDVNSIKLRNNISPLKMNRTNAVIDERKEVVDSTSISSSSELKSDNEENNFERNYSKKYVSRSNSLATTRVLLPNETNNNILKKFDEHESNSSSSTNSDEDSSSFRKLHSHKIL